MGIKRWTANKDSTITNAFKSNLITRATASNIGASDVLEVFSIRGQANTSSIEQSRALLQFPVTQISSSRKDSEIPVSGNVNFYLKMFNAEHEETLPRDFDIAVVALSQSWDEGYGLDMEGYEDKGLGAGGWGCTWVSRQTGSVSEGSFTFDGANDYITVSDHDDLSFVDSDGNDEAFSISAWVYIDDTDDEQPIISKWTDDKREYALLVDSSGALTLRLFDESADADVLGKTDNSTIAEDTWYHVVATYSGKGGAAAGDGIKLYVDNVSKTVNLTYTNTYVDMEDLSQALTLGTRKDVSAGSSTYLDGKLDDVSLWDKELDRGEIEDIYNDGCPTDLKFHSAYKDSSSNLIAWWRFETDVSVVTTADNDTADTSDGIRDHAGSHHGTPKNTSGSELTTSNPGTCTGSIRYWMTAGGAIDDRALTSYSASFPKGTEDLEVNITALVEEWLINTTASSAGRPDYGVLVYLSGTYEDGQRKRSYYTKKFFGRESEFELKRPVIEARWDSSKRDDTNNFFLSSSLMNGADNLNTIYLYNSVKGELKNIPAVGQRGIFVTLYDKINGTPIALPAGGGIGTANDINVTGAWVEKGIYSASFAYTSSNITSFYPVWHSGSAKHSQPQYHTGAAISVKTFDSVDYNPRPTYVTKITNLRSTYAPIENARLRVHIRQKDWSPTIYTKAVADAEANYIEDAHYKIIRLSDNFVVVPYDTGSAVSGTMMSYDSKSNYFDLDMGMFQKDYAYGIKFLLKTGGKYVEQEETHKFRVE